MISIKHKYNIGVFYTIRAPGVHVHARVLNISLFLFLCVCRRVHAPLCHYWTCMHTLRWFMMKIHQIYGNISSEMYIYGQRRNFSAFFCCFISRLEEHKKRNNAYITIKCSLFWEKTRFPPDVPAVYSGWHSLLILRRPLTSHRSKTTCLDSHLSCVTVWPATCPGSSYASVLSVS